MKLEKIASQMLNSVFVSGAGLLCKRVRSPSMLENEQQRKLQAFEYAGQKLNEELSLLVGFFCW